VRELIAPHRKRNQHRSSSPKTSIIRLGPARLPI
jgi:hypothetical protein